MPVQLFSVALLLFSFINLVLAIYGWSQRQHKPGVALLAVYMLGMTLASFGYGMELLSADLQVKLFWVGVRYIGNTGLATPTFLLICLWYSGHDIWLKRERVLLLCVQPVFSLLGFFTNPWHHLHYTTIALERSGPLIMLEKTNGPLYLFMIVLWLVYQLTGIWLAASTMGSLPRMYFGQSLAIFTAGTLPTLFTLAYLSGWRPLPGLNLTPFVYFLSSLLLLEPVLRGRLFSVSPVTLELLYEKIPTGVIVLDYQQRVAAINPAAQAVLERSPKSIIGQPLESACAHWPALRQWLAQPPGKPPLEIQHWTSERYFSIEITVPQQDSARANQIILINDVTRRHAAEAVLLQQQRDLAALAEREQIARDLHDGVGQLTGFVSVQSQAARQYLANHQLELADAALASLLEAAREAHSDVRSYILDLKQDRAEKRPQPDDFFSELERYSARFQKLYGLSVQLQLPPPADRPALAQNVSLQLLRVVQEALSNVRKHSGAPGARVTVQHAAGQLLLVVEDEGAGFDPQTAIQAGHLGLEIMAERAALTGIQLEVRSSPGQGTRVCATLALASPPPQVSIQLNHLRVLLVDDQELFRVGLRNLLAARGVQVVAEAADGRQAVAQAHRCRPDLILMDLNMPEMDGIAATRQIHEELPGMQIVALTVAEDTTTLMEVLRAGACGYLLKNLQADQLFNLLEAVCRGEKPVNPTIAMRALQVFSGAGEASVPDQLNERQLELLQLAARNLTNAQIALRLNLSEATVKYHFHQIFERLQVHNRGEALSYAAQRGWIDRRR